jgi:catechol 2,3-dioxygenase-like lactoylglutathione lyase family enzyme
MRKSSQVSCADLRQGDRMFHHVQLAVSDFPRALRFWRACLEPLGFVAQSVDEAGKSAGFGPPGAPKLWIGAGERRGPVHLAFDAKDSQAVEQFYKAALAAGGKDHGKPGPRPDYSPTYWAAFVIDPDGNNIEAVVV